MCGSGWRADRLKSLKSLKSSKGFYTLNPVYILSPQDFCLEADRWHSFLKPPDLTPEWCLEPK